MMNNLILFIVTLALSPTFVHAYAGFVSYGYKSCVFCHYNSQGGGALNDYGRAVFASEFASTAFLDKTTTAEKLSESSGFFGSYELPWFLRPGAKYRGLWMMNSPGSKSSTSRFIPMQADLSLALHFDKENKFVFVGTIGYLPTPIAVRNSSGALQKPSQFISREHYLRWQTTKELLLSFGLMDKTFGVRTVDHTAVNRSKLGFGQNDQAHGIQAHYSGEDWEFTLHPFFGNMNQSAPLRQQGLSAMYEKDIEEKIRVGGSVLSSKNKFIEWTRAGAHSKLGYGEGNSLLTEIGIAQNKPKTGASENGGYLFLENLGFITQGYYILSQLEYFNQTLSSKSPDQFRWTFGLLSFPFPKGEFRTSIINARTQSDTGFTEDQWQLQTQFHLSL